MIKTTHFRTLLSFLLVIVFFASCTQKETRTYYDDAWKETAKENASYYRELVKQDATRWLVMDYYITGEKQFFGFAKDSLATILEGDATWYFKSGKVSNKVRYQNGVDIGSFYVISGALGSESEGWLENDLIFLDESGVESAQNAVADAAQSTPENSVNVIKSFYESTNTIARIHTNYIGEEQDKTNIVYFNTKGDTIARLNRVPGTNKWNGKQVVFYGLDKVIPNSVGAINEISTYANGAIIKKEVFTKEQQLIAEGVFENKKPLNGTFLKEECRYFIVETYQNANLINGVTYTRMYDEVGELSYKNGLPFTGQFYSCHYFQTYENGKLNGKMLQYFYETDQIVQEEYNFKNGIKHGDYALFQDENLLLEKGQYKNGVLNGEITYYRNEDYYNSSAEGKLNYYLKVDVKSIKDKPYVSEIKQFKTESNALLQTFKLEKNSTDKFSYLENGTHKIILKDLNNDGFKDLQITLRYYENDLVANTFYLFDPKTKKYAHLPELDDALSVSVDTKTNELVAAQVSRFKEQIKNTTYQFVDKKLIKKTVEESVYHTEIDSLIVTQLFPVQLEKYPLLDASLPPLKILQGENQYELTSTRQSITLNKEPFKIQLSGLADKGKWPFGFNMKLVASYHASVFNRVTINYKEEETTCFGKGSTFAMGYESPFLVIDDSGHNRLFYDKTKHSSLELVKTLNDKVLLLEYSVNKILDEVGVEDKTISDIDQPIYMVIYTDKNANLKIEENEIHYLTLQFKS